MQPRADTQPDGTLACTGSAVLGGGPCRWSEVPHKGTMRLRRSGSKFFLEHLVSGEVAALPEGHSWELHLHGDKMFASSPTHNPLWCTKLLKTSLWAKSGRILVFGKAMLADSRDLNVWLDEAVQQRRAICINMQVPVGSGQTAHLPVKGYALVLPRAGARVFVEAKKIAEFVASGVRNKSSWFRQGLRRHWISSLGRRFAVPIDHIIPGSSGVAVVGAPSDIAVHNCSLSTSALLLLLCLWVTLFTKVDRVNSALGVILALVMMLPQQCSICIEMEAHAGTHIAQSIQVELCSGNLGPCVELQPTMRELVHTWPFKSVRLHLLPSLLAGQFDHILAKVFVGVAAELDKLLATSKPPEPIDLLSMGQHEVGPVDPELREAVGRLTRNRYQIGAFAKVMKSKLLTHDARVDHMEQTRYWLAARRAMSEASTVALTTDATRFSKQDWNCGTVCNVSTKQFAWLQPVAAQQPGGMTIDHKGHSRVFDHGVLRS